MKPTVVTLCGSTRFKKAFIEAAKRETLAGKIVLTVGTFGHVDMPEHDWTTGKTDLKVMLDQLHFAKIDMSDEILVLDLPLRKANPDNFNVIETIPNYIGESTRNEINHAEKLGLPIRYWSDEFAHSNDKLEDWQ